MAIMMISQCNKTTNVAQNQPWAKRGLFAAAALRPIFCGLIAALCSNKFVKKLKACIIISSTADESPEFLWAAGKIVHRA